VQSSKALEDPLRFVPRVPGVYFLYDSRGRLLYIGKAKRLRDRLRSYRRVDPRTAPENVAQLAPRIREVRWQVCASERAALRRESELLHAIRPPFNLAGVERGHYLFIVLGVSGPGPEVKLGFELTDEPEVTEDERIFGCYQHWRKVKLGYTALLRLIYACRLGGRRFYSYPARISRDSPPWTYSTPFPAEWVDALFRFLDGRNVELLRLMTSRLLSNEAVPPFLYPAIQEDLRVARTFYDLGPRGSRRLKLKHAVDLPVLSHAMMDELTGRGIESESFAGRAEW
jgi:excinuclease UvrABC nuclease subunit